MEIISVINYYIFNFLYYTIINPLVYTYCNSKVITNFKVQLLKWLNKITCRNQFSYHIEIDYLTGKLT